MTRYQRRLHNRALREAGTPVKRGQPFKLSAEIRAEIPAMVKKKSTRRVAYWLGVAQSTVWRYSKS